LTSVVGGARNDALSCVVLLHAKEKAGIERAQLSDGTPWTLPITLPAGDGGRGLHEGAVVALRDDGNRPIGVLTVDEVYERDLEREASEVYRRAFEHWTRPEPYPGTVEATLRVVSTTPPNDPDPKSAIAWPK